MKHFSEQHIFGGVPPSRFVGRERETERLLKLSRGNGGLALLATPNSGSSELLRQVFDRLFAEQEDVIPVYFAVKASDGSALQAARRFLREFLVQTVAFRRRNAFILDASPDINEIAELAVPADALWIDRVIETAGEYGNDDEISRLRSFLSSPIRAAASGASVFIIVDDLHETANLSGGQILFEALTDLFRRCELPFVFCGHRRFLYGRTPFETMRVGRLSFADSGILAESLAAEYGVSLNEQTRDLIAVQLQGDPRFMNFLFASAADKSVGFDSFQQVETVYTDEIFGGRISRYFDAIFDSVAPDAASQSQLLGMIADLLNSDTNKASLEFWQAHTDLEFDGFRRVIAKLNDLEIISTTANSVGASPDSIVAADHIAARHRLNKESTARAQIVGEGLTNSIRRAPGLRAKFYRQL
ncbi:MAG: ATP-binding protein, partial [Pyrinomonadaceae bacterium]